MQENRSHANGIVRLLTALVVVGGVAIAPIAYGHSAWLAIVIGVVVGLFLRLLPLLTPGDLRLADHVVVYVLLPSHVALTLQILQGSFQSLLLAGAFGLLLPILTYAVARNVSSSTAPASLALAAASFGGGNRGVLLLTLLTLFSSLQNLGMPPITSPLPTGPTLLDHFAVMDFAYFFVFANALVLFHYSTLPKHGGASRVWQAISLAIVIATSLINPVDKGWATTEQVLSYRTELSGALSIICTALVVARMRGGMSLGVLSQALAILTARSLVLTVFSAIVFVMLTAGAIHYLDALYLLIPFAIFLVVPPSSYIGSIVNDNDDAAEAEQITKVAALWSLLFYGSMIAFAVFGLLHAQP